MPLGQSCLAVSAPQADSNSTSALTVHDLASPLYPRSWPTLAHLTTCPPAAQGVGLPAFGFLAFLVCAAPAYAQCTALFAATDRSRAIQIWRVQPSLRKLHISRSHIMATYYVRQHFCRFAEPALVACEVRLQRPAGLHVAVRHIWGGPQPGADP